MFDLTIQINSGRTYDAYTCKIISQGEAVYGDWTVPEDATVSIDLVIDDKASNLGEPEIYIGDVLHECTLYSKVGTGSHWRVTFDDDDDFGIPFRNFVGRSEVILTFKKSDLRVRNLIDIQANQINASLAEGMLEYLNKHYDSIVSICFSRSKISSDVGRGNEDSINRLIEEAESGVKLCESVWPELLTRIRETWDTRLEYQSHSLPNSPQGIAWLVQNPEAIHFCDKNEQMFNISGYPVLTTKSAREIVVHNRDLIENRIVHGYLAHLEQKMLSTIALLKKEVAKPKNSRGISFNDYISLDYILCKHRTPIILGLVSRLNDLISRVKLLNKRFCERVPRPSSLKPIPPRVTPYVARTTSYLKVFDKISKWYEFGKVQIGIGDTLFGLRHLSTLYEFTVLTQLISLLNRSGFRLNQSSWRDYDVANFGGEDRPRPVSAVNNYFCFSDSDRHMKVELFYEPKIWTSKRAQPGDPVDVCIEHQGKYWQHRKPDYLFRVWFDGVKEPVLLIFDAKFSSAYRVKNDKLPELINKYLLGLHQKRVDGGYGQLPIQAVWALYPKGNAHKIDFYSSAHSLGSKDSILPSLGGIRVRPDDDEQLEIMFGSLLNKLHEEFSVRDSVKQFRVDQKVA